ncbi:MAG: RHS repeat-associated core domain-containing protein, partial [Myxococcota bacterium]
AQDGRSPGSGPGIRHDFTGHERDGELINMRGRMYDPALRRFLAPDPLLTGALASQGHNAYSYVLNNPFRFTDPSGFSATEYARENSTWEKSHYGADRPNPPGSGSSPPITPACAIANGCSAPPPPPPPPPPPITGAGSQTILTGDAAGGFLSGFRGGALPNVSNGAQDSTAGNGRDNASGRTPQEAFEDRLLQETGDPVPTPPSPPTFDPLTEHLLKSLRPELEVLAREHIFALRQTGADARVVQGTRTYAEQARRYAIGRTRPGNIVTNAPPGTSAHNFGAAYDIGFFDKGQYLGNSPLYTTIGPAAAPGGVVWGRDVPGFPPGDLGHYQLPNWEGLPPR